MAAKRRTLSKNGAPYTKTINPEQILTHPKISWWLVAFYRVAKNKLF